MGVVASVAIACALATTFSLWRDLPRVIADYRPCLLLDVAHVRSVVPYSLASYLAGLLASSQRTILPLVVLEMLGREANAHAYAAMMIGSLLASPAAALATAAFAESAHAPRHVSVIMWPAAILGVGLSIPAAGLLAVAAPQVLALFGTTYAREAVGLTRWLALAAPLNALKELYLARLRVEARMGELIACNAISSSLIVVLSAALLPQLGLSGIGLASLFAQGSLACLGARDVLVGARRSSAKTQVAGPGKRSLKIALVCSHGGHLTEMEMLAPAFEGHRCFLVTYRSVRTQGLPGTCYLLHNIGSSPWRLLCAFAHAVRILWRERPDVIVSTGSEIAIPFLWLGRLVGMRTAYVETWCRMTGPSRTGKLVYPASDLFLVQWPALLEHYGPRARYEGGLM
jgi:hypothetical protein